MGFPPGGVEDGLRPPLELPGLRTEALGPPPWDPTPATPLRNCTHPSATEQPPGRGGALDEASSKFGVLRIGPRAPASQTPATPPGCFGVFPGTERPAGQQPGPESLKHLVYIATYFNGIFLEFNRTIRTPVKMISNPVNFYGDHLRCDRRPLKSNGISFQRQQKHSNTFRNASEPLDINGNLVIDFEI